MAIIGSLLLDLGVNTGRFQNDLVKASSARKKFERESMTGMQRVKKSFASTGAAVRKLRTGMLALAGVAGIGYLIKRNIEAADAIGKTADAIGISTTALQQYRFAASQAGVETTLMESVFTAFTKRVGEAKAGVGPLTTFLKKFDEQLLTNITNTKNQDQALALVFKRMQGMTNAADRAALANAAFSRSGITLVNMAKNGAIALEDMREKASSLGIVIDEDLIRRSEDANDQLDIMQKIIGAQMVDAITRLAPQIVWLGNAFVKLSKIISPTPQLQVIKDQIKVVQMEIENAIKHIDQSSMIDRLLGTDWEVRLKTFQIEYESLMKSLAKESGVQYGQLTFIGPPKPGPLPGDALVPKPEKAKKALKKIEAAGVTAFDQMKSATESWGDTLAGQIATAKLNFKDLSRSIITDISRILIQQNVTNRLVSAGVTALGGTGLFPGKAAGGPVSGGRPYIVGERGPEMFVPRQSGTVVPNDRLSGITISQANSISIDARGADAGVEVRIRQAVEEGAKRGYQLVLNDLHRNGPVRGAIS